MSQGAPGGPGLEPALPSDGLARGRGTTTTHHNLGSTNSQKTLLFQVVKCYWSLWGTWQDGGRPGLGDGAGAGLRPLQKSKAFIKNAINWYQKKTRGRLEEEAERKV